MLWSLPIFYAKYWLLGYIQTFFGGGDFVLGVYFHRADLLWGENFLGVNFPGEIFHRGNLIKFVYEILFYCLIFSLPNQVCMWRFSVGIIWWLFSAYFGFQKKIQRMGLYPEWLGNWLEIKVVLEIKYDKKNFSCWIVCKTFYARGIFSEEGTISMEFDGGGLLYVGWKFSWRSLSWGGISHGEWGRFTGIIWETIRN